MNYTDPKQIRKGITTVIVGIFLVDILGYLLIDKTEQNLLKDFVIIICIELIILLGSFVLIQVNKTEKSLFISLIMLIINYILAFYILWLSIANREMGEYLIMIWGLMVGALCGFLYLVKKQEKKKQEKKVPRTIFPILICSTVGILLAKVVGTFLSQNYIRMLGELAIDVIMMIFAFAIGCGISRVISRDK